MKYLILIAFAFLISCEKMERDDTLKEPKGVNKNTLPKHYNFFETKIDSCDYIIFAGGYAPSIIHKENCNNHKK